MATQIYTRMALAYGNVVKPELIDTLTPGGISGFESGFPADALEYEDPWTMCKTNGISGTPTFYYDFLAAPNARVLGVLNHSLFSSGYTQVQVWYFTAGYLSVGTKLIESDDDLWFGWDTVTSATLWKIEFTPSANDFYIGSIFMGPVPYQTLRNPSARGIQQTRKTDMTVERASGGAKLFNWGAAKRDATMSLSWERAEMSDVLWFRQRARDELIGVYSPEYADVGQYVNQGQEVFWGYVNNRGMKPRGPGASYTGQQARYEFVVNLEGAV